jgi:hypothetical protein
MIRALGPRVREAVASVRRTQLAVVRRKSTKLFRVTHKWDSD